MKYDPGLQGVYGSDIITLKLFEEGYVLTNKEHFAKCNISAHFQKYVITEHWMENIDFFFNKMGKYG